MRVLFLSEENSAQTGLMAKLNLPGWPWSMDHQMDGSVNAQRQWWAERTLSRLWTLLPSSCAADIKKFQAHAAAAVAAERCQHAVPDQKPPCQGRCVTHVQIPKCKRPWRRIILCLEGREGGTM